MTINQDKLGEFLGTFVTDLGAAIAAGNVVVGHRLGLYRNLAGGPGRPRRSSRSAPAPTPGMWRSGCAGRPRAGT